MAKEGTNDVELAEIPANDVDFRVALQNSGVFIFRVVGQENNPPDDRSDQE